MSDAPMGLSMDALFEKMQAETRPTHGYDTRRKGESLAAWQNRLRRRFCELLAFDARPRKAPSMRFMEEIQCNGYVRRRGYMLAADGLAVPVYVLTPDPAPAKKLPVCLCVHGHGPGKSISVGLAQTEAARQQLEDIQEDYAVQAVRQGYIAIAHDSRSFGELMLEEDYRKDGYSSCSSVSMRSIHMGRPLNGQRLSDIMQLVDWAVAQKNVDPERIVITGNSHGGMLSLYAAALDKRIAAAAPCCYLCTFAGCLMDVFHCPCNFIPSLGTVCDMPDLAGLVAPRPMLVIAATKDPMFAIDESRKAYQQTRRIYQDAGAAKELEFFEGAGGHRYYNHRVWSFFEEKLKT